MSVAVERAHAAHAGHWLAAVRLPVWLVVLWSGAALSTIALGAVDGPAHAMVAVVWGGLLLVVGSAAVGRFVTEERGFALRLFVGAFLARYVSAVVLVSALRLSPTGRIAGGSDYFHYDARGWQQAEVWRSGDFSWIITFADAGYYYLIAAVYTVTGHYLMAPTLLNALFGGFAAVLTFLLATRLFGRPVGVLAGALAAFIPTLLFWSGLLYKDVIISFLVVAAVYLAAELREKLSASRAVMLALVLGPLFALRTGMAAVLVLLLGVFLFARRKHIGRRVAALAGAAVLLVGFMSGLDRLGIGGGGLGVGLELAAAMTEAGAGFSGELARRGGDGFAQALYGQDLLRSPHLFLLALGFMFVTPVPGAGPVGLNFATFLTPGQIVWIFLIPALVLGVLQVLRRRRAAELFLLGVTGAAVTAVILGGYVSNPRYLIQVVPLMLILMSVGVRQLGAGWHLYLAGLSAVGSLLVVYLMVR